MAKDGKDRRSTKGSSATSDPRFASIATDPRYRLPSTKNARVGVDQRFSRMFKDDDFNRKSKVDRYGRKQTVDKDKKELRRLYEEDEKEAAATSKGKVTKPKKKELEVASASESEGESEEADLDEADDDAGVQAELRRLDRARQGGFSSSEEESSDEEDEDEDEEVVAELPDERQANPVPMGEVSSRIAVVNLDWDHIRAVDVMAVAHSFLPASGGIKQVSIYPSEFGKERMQREELEGPPREIFASSRPEDDEDEDEDSEDEEERIRKDLLKEDTSEEFDSAKLRAYQLDRLRYYYAVITCDSNVSAKALYDSMDGREYLTTSNFFDLRFIPDEFSFDDDKSRDECNQVPEKYTPNDFATEALTHSKVKLTWDNDDTSRKEAQKRAFSRAELDDNDLQAYIGSDSSDSEPEVPTAAAPSSSTAPKSDREAQRQKMRAALGLTAAGSEKAAKKNAGPVGDMQVTFTSGLSSSKGNSVFENAPITDETTKERYVRKEKERKERRRQKAKAARNGDADSGSGDDVVTGSAQNVDGEGDDDDSVTKEDPFDDPFFNDAPAAQRAEKAMRKADRLKKREERRKEEDLTAAKRKELELLMVDDREDQVRHFNMNEIAKAEKMEKKRGKKGRKGKSEEDAAAVQDVPVETSDPRFAGLFESHEFAIDPSKPQYRATKGMKALLEEGRKRRKEMRDEGPEAEDGVVQKKGKKRARVEEDGEPDKEGDQGEIKALLARVKSRHRNKA